MLLPPGPTPPTGVEHAPQPQLGFPLTRGTHPLSSVSSMPVATVLAAPSNHNQESMVPSGLQQLHGPTVSSSRSRSPRWVHPPRGVTHGGQHTPPATPQTAPTAGPPAASPSQITSVPQGFRSMCSGWPQRNQSRARSTGSKKKSVCWGKDPLGPSAPARCSGPLNPAERPGRGRHRTRAAHSALDAARVSTRGRGSKREEGPQASTRIGRPDSVRGPCQEHG
ncbi:hypothetical protein NDU88_008158 [Pleurodeles waltl]|uniref:Uncharacterized protein n=1 Tax=Pleurodeles waltl TaxID=8319 RepID=A0AAV7P462_PLEWA|nr:hypothetical protein NDU88_008158 [Pleurodeles waltl]